MYDKIKVVVLCKDKQDVAKYRRLFRFMLKDQLVEERVHNDYGRLETEKIRIEFFVGGLNMRGHRAHFVINLVQDEELHNMIALPMTVIHSYLKDDPHWAELFEDISEPYKAVLRKYEGKWFFKSNHPNDSDWNEESESTALKLIMKQGWTVLLDRGDQDGLYAFKKERENEQVTI